MYTNGIRKIMEITEPGISINDAMGDAIKAGYLAFTFNGELY